MAITLTNTNSRPVVSGEGTTVNVGVAVAIDYTTYYDRIATALETIATQTTTVASNLGEIEAHQQKLRELGEGPGIHVIGPWEWVGLSSIVKLLQDKGADFAALKAAVESLPTNY